MTTLAKAPVTDLMATDSTNTDFVQILPLAYAG